METAQLESHPCSAQWLFRYIMYLQCLPSNCSAERKYLREAVLLSLGAMFMSPVASSSYNMAAAMGGDGDFAGTVVVSTSVLSVVTIFLWVFLLSSFGMI